MGAVVVRREIHDAGLHVDNANAAILQVGKIKLRPRRIEGETVNAGKVRLERGTAIARVTFFTRPREGRDGAGRGIDFANALVPRVGQVNGPIR